MTDKVTFSEHVEEKEENNGLRALDVNEDFVFKIFTSSCNNQNTITEPGQWYIPKHFIYFRTDFINGLKNACLVDDSDLQNLDSFWRLKAKIARNDPTKISISFDELIDHVIPFYKAQEDDIVDDDISILNREITRLGIMSEDWDIDNLKGVELRNLLSILVSIGEKNDEVMNNIEHYIQEQKDYLLLQDMRELFWKQIPFELTSLKLGENISPWDYQRENTNEIEKRFISYRISDVSLIFAIQKAINENFTSVDRFGHCINHEYGIYSTIALYKQNNQPIEIVAVPKYGQPYNCINKMANIISAHKQMILSNYFPKYYGNDVLQMEDYIVYYYQAIKAYPLSYLLKFNKCNENDVIFRYWCRKILLAFQELLQMSTHSFSYPLTCDNILISDEGITVLLGQIDWDREVHPIDINSSEFLEERESMLVESFGNIVKNLLNTIDNSKTLDNVYINENFSTYTLPVYIENENVSNVNPPYILSIYCGDVFALRLPMPKSKEYKWIEPEIIIDKSSPEKLIERDGSILIEQDNEMCRFSLIQFKSKKVGKCVIFLYYLRNWDILPPKPTIEITINIMYPEMSPVLSAILKCCKNPKSINNEGELSISHRQPSLIQLLSHPYFSAKNSNDSVEGEKEIIENYEYKYMKSVKN